MAINQLLIGNHLLFVKIQFFNNQALGAFITLAAPAGVVAWAYS